MTHNLFLAWSWFGHGQLTVVASLKSASGWKGIVRCDITCGAIGTRLRWKRIKSPRSTFRTISSGPGRACELWRSFGGKPHQPSRPEPLNHPKTFWNHQLQQRFNGLRSVEMRGELRHDRIQSQICTSQCDCSNQDLRRFSQDSASNSTHSHSI